MKQQFSFAYMVFNTPTDLVVYPGLIEASSKAEAHGLISIMAKRVHGGKKRIEVKIGAPMPNCLITDIETATMIVD